MDPIAVHVLTVVYCVATVIFLFAGWGHATKWKIPEDVLKRRKQRMARFSLFFPFWLPWLVLELIWWLIRTAIGPKKQVRSDRSLCPECLSKAKKGPHR